MTLPIKIEIRDVYKVFGAKEVLAVQLLKQGADKTTVQAETGCNVGLAGVSALIPKGQISCIMGLSGSGKSTLVRHLNRLIVPSAGELLVDGANILTQPMPALRKMRRHELTIVVQGFGPLQPL